MYFRCILALVCVTVLLTFLPAPGAAQRIYIRHKRSIERENVPAKESTVVLQGPNGTDPAADLPKDFENEITGSEKDCKDFLEFDYNPINDSMFFNGRIPSVFQNHHRNLNSFEEMFHRMLNQASSMFNRFPMEMPAFNNNYPDNYNGTVEEEVTINGQRFRKKQHVINKSTGGSKISIMSTVYEPVRDESNSTINPESTDASTVDDLTDGKVINYK